MSQLSLFAPPRLEPRPSDPAFIRRNCQRLLRLAKRAEIMPWSDAEARKWERFFPQLTETLPEDEGKRLREEFAAELARLRAL